MKKIFLTILSGIICLTASAQELVSEALPFMQMDFNPSSVAMGSTRIPGAAILPLSGTKLAAGVAYESYMPDFGGTQYVSGGVAGTTADSEHRWGSPGAPETRLPGSVLRLARFW